jgi:hypothetical protein
LGNKNKQLRKSNGHRSPPNYKINQITGQPGHQLMMLPTPDPFWGEHHGKKGTKKNDGF